MASFSASWTYVGVLTAMYFDVLDIASRSMATNVNMKSATYEQPPFQCIWEPFLCEASSQNGWGITDTTKLKLETRNY